MNEITNIKIYRLKDIEYYYLKDFPSYDLRKDWRTLEAMTVSLDGTEWVLADPTALPSENCFTSPQARDRVLSVLVQCTCKSLNLCSPCVAVFPPQQILLELSQLDFKLAENDPNWQDKVLNRICQEWRDTVMEYQCDLC